MEKEIKLIILLYIILFAALSVALAFYHPATKEELEQAKEFCYGNDGSDKYSFKK